VADIELSRALPVLPVHEIKGATAFYRDVLGFELAFDMGTTPASHVGLSNCTSTPPPR